MVTPGWLVTVPTMMLTGTFPARVPAGTRTSTCIAPATTPSTPPAYRTSAGWPSTTACTLSLGLGRGEDPALPSTPAGVVNPSPVWTAKQDLRLCRGQD